VETAMNQFNGLDLAAAGEDEAQDNSTNDGQT